MITNECTNKNFHDKTIKWESQFHDDGQCFVCDNIEGLQDEICKLEEQGTEDYAKLQERFEELMDLYNSFARDLQNDVFKKDNYKDIVEAMDYEVNSI